jgi:hypothetical protein
MTQTDTLERTAIVAYTLLQELHRVLADPHKPDEISLGIILGTAMFCDDKVGPFRARQLLQQAPEIVLKTDAHVADEQVRRMAPVLHAFGEHLQALALADTPSTRQTEEAMTAV